MAEQFDRAMQEHAHILAGNPPLNDAIKRVDAFVAIAKGILLRNRVHDFEAADVVALAGMIAARERDEITAQQV